MTCFLRNPLRSDGAILKGRRHSGECGSEPGCGHWGRSELEQTAEESQATPLENRVPSPRPWPQALPALCPGEVPCSALGSQSGCTMLPRESPQAGEGRPPLGPEGQRDRPPPPRDPAVVLLPRTSCGMTPGPGWRLICPLAGLGCGLGHGVLPDMTSSSLTCPRGWGEVRAGGGRGGL